MPRRSLTAAEDDVLYGRHMYCYLKRAGVSAGIKRQMRRRERREGKTDTRDWES